MFCSKCGLTIHAGEPICSNCGKEIGESVFPGFPETSVQTVIRTMRDVKRAIARDLTAADGISDEERESGFSHEYSEVVNASYTGNPEDVEQDDVAERTIYHVTPEVADAADAPDVEARRARAAAREQAREESTEPPARLTRESAEFLEEVADELRPETPDLTEFDARPYTEEPARGISEGVSELMERYNVSPDSEEDVPEPEEDAENAPGEPEEEAGEDAPRRERKARRRSITYGRYDDDSTTGGDEGMPGDEDASAFEIPDDEDLGGVRGPFGLKQILGIVAAVVVMAALVVVGVSGFKNVRNGKSFFAFLPTRANTTIQNVRQDLYTAGLDLVTAHSASENTGAIIQDFSSKGNDLITLASQLQANKEAVTALRPEDATEEEGIFVSALEKIEDNINNCITSDAIAVAQNDQEGIAESDSRWKVVNNSIMLLKECRSATELTAIINGEVVDVLEVHATATPTPSVNYNTLSKGSQGPEVLAMQNRLYELGYLKDTRDGQFGNNTMTAVKIFQSQAGLPVTGIADAATLNALYAEDAPRAEPAA